MDIAISSGRAASRRSDQFGGNSSPKQPAPPGRHRRSGALRDGLQLLNGVGIGSRMGVQLIEPPGEWRPMLGVVQHIRPGPTLVSARFSRPGGRPAEPSGPIATGSEEADRALELVSFNSRIQCGRLDPEHLGGTAGS